MKHAIILGLTSATILMAGCTKQTSVSSTTLPGDSEPVAVSAGSNTFHLGALTINGTNVSDTNITVGVRTRPSSK